MNENLFGLTANLIDACFLVVGKGGKILNARGNRICFILDICCLSYWVHMDIMRGLYSQAVSAIVSMCICIYGFKRWGKMNSMSNKDPKYTPKQSTKSKKAQMTNEQQAAMKAKIAKAPLVPNRLPFDQGTCI